MLNMFLNPVIPVKTDRNSINTQCLKKHQEKDSFILILNKAVTKQLILLRELSSIFTMLLIRYKQITVLNLLTERKPIKLILLIYCVTNYISTTSLSDQEHLGITERLKEATEMTKKDFTII